MWRMLNLGTHLQTFLLLLSYFVNSEPAPEPQSSHLPYSNPGVEFGHRNEA